MIPIKLNFWQEVKDYLFIFLGIIIYTIGLTFFILPYQLTTGGLTGIALIIFYATGFPIQYSYLILNGILIIAAIKILGFKFCIRTLVGIFGLSFMLAFAQEIVADADGNLPHLIGDQTFMAVVIGGCLEGCGLAIIFLNNGSTGGTDIIAAIINKYRDVTLGRLMAYCDMIIISSCYFVFHDWQKVVMGFAVLIVSNFMLDYVMNSARQSVQFLIFSSKYDEIAEAISTQLGRGVTLLDGEGWYSKRPCKVLVILAKRRESVYMFRIIKQIDPNAFVSQSNVVGVYGEGFDKIKVK